MVATSTVRDALAIDARAQRGLRISVLDGCVYAVMVGASESFLGPMAVELGHRDTGMIERVYGHVLRDRDRRGTRGAEVRYETARVLPLVAANA